MQVLGLTMITQPDHRQDPWRESLEQMLSVFDGVIVVYGHESDHNELKVCFGREIQVGKLIPRYLHWPQPEWSYEELPKHLNTGLEIAYAMAKMGRADWAIKLDIDNFIHESQGEALRQALATAKGSGYWLASLQKYQFHMVDRCFEKGKMPLAINLHSGQPIFYGFDLTRYTDLCQPIVREWSHVKLPSNPAYGLTEERSYEIPSGMKVPDNKVFFTGVHVWNYDYSFKSRERATELLYHFDRSHALFWGAGYTGKLLSEITEKSALHDFLNMIQPRIGRATKRFEAKDHPAAIRERVKSIKPEEMGHSIWGFYKP